jgi:hypothetical protein
MGDASWSATFQQAQGLLERLYPCLSAPTDTDRGEFYQLRAGPSYGGGQKVSSTLTCPFVHTLTRRTGADAA